MARRIEVFLRESNIFQQTPFDMENKSARIGRVKFFDANKGFGFIDDLTSPEAEDDVYFNHEVIRGAPPVDGQFVYFEAEPSDIKPGTLQASQVLILSNADLPKQEVLEVAELIPNTDVREQAVAAAEGDDFDSQSPSGQEGWMIGRVKFFDSTKGFGFINPLLPVEGADGDVYVNEEHVPPKGLRDGGQVVFRLIRTESAEDSVQAGQVRNIEAFEGPHEGIIEVLVREAKNPSSHRDSLHRAGLQTLPQADLESYVQQVMVHCREEDPDDLYRIIEKLIDRLKKVFDEGTLPDPIRSQVESTVRQLLKRDALSATEWVDLLIYGYAPVPPPDVLDSAMQSGVEYVFHKVAPELRRKDALDFVEWVSKRVKDMETSSDIRSLLERANRVARAATDGDDLKKIQDQLDNLAAERVRKDKLTNEDILGLWDANLLSEVPASTFARVLDEVRTSKVIDYLSELSGGLLETVVKERTHYLLTDSESGEDELSRLETWLQSLKSLIDRERSGGKEPTLSLVFEEDSDLEVLSVYRFAASVIGDTVAKSTQVELYGEQLLYDVPEEWLLNNIDSVSRSLVGDVLSHPASTSSLKRKILKEYAEELLREGDGQESSARFVAKQGENHLSDTDSQQLVALLTNKIDEGTHRRLWEDAVIDVLPTGFLDSHFQEMTAEDVEEAEEWCERGILPATEFISRLTRFLKELPNRYDENYPVVAESARCISELNQSVQDQLSDCSGAVRDMAHVSLWLDGNSDYFDINAIQRAFISLPTDQQTLGLRRLFVLHAQDEIELSVSDLSELSRVNLDELSSSRIVPEERPLALSSEIIIKTLEKVRREGELLLEGELLKLALFASKKGLEESIGVADVFNRCTGRSKVEYNWGLQRGEVKEVHEQGRRLFRISFPYDEELVEEVKKLPSRRYNPDTKIWTVPGSSQGEQAVIQFAREYDLFLNRSDGKHETNNPHFQILKSEGYPCSYCEGRKARQKHNYYDREFWWCRGDTCFQANKKTRGVDEWENYTLQDFISLLELDEGGEAVLEQRDYDRYMATANRFEELLDHLECRGCNQYMHPVDDSAYAHYRVTHFHCVNDECTEFGQEVYLQHCLNPACSWVIDSRDTTQCPNGWWICRNPECGACCSTEKMEQRLNYLRKVGRPIPGSLKRFVKREKGHVERAEHYCYSCGKQMPWLQNIDPNLFRCEKCGVEYDTSDAAFKRDHAQRHSPVEESRLDKAREQHLEKKEKTFSRS